MIENGEDRGDGEDGEKEEDSPINLCYLLQRNSIFTNGWTTMTDKVPLFPIIIQDGRG
jgi:hypothetical protein